MSAGLTISPGIFPETRPLAVMPIDLTASLESGARHRVSLPGAGQLLAGSVSGNGMRLLLVGADDETRRVLVKGDTDGDEFALLGQAGERQTLIVEARRSGKFRLLVRSVPLLPSVPAKEAEPESPRLRRALADGDLEAFWQKVQNEGAPLVEYGDVLPSLGRDEALVSFLWRGAQHNVRLLGAPTGEHEELKRIPGTDLWFASFRIPTHARLTYKLAPDVPQPADPSQLRTAIVATLQRDPLNPRYFPAAVSDIHDGESILELPDAPPALAFLPMLSATLAGQMESHRVRSQALGNERDIHLYRSPGYRSEGKGNPLLVFLDGEVHVHALSTPALLEHLVTTGELPPLAALFVSNPDRSARSRELPPNPGFVRFLADELMPWADAQRVSATPSCTLLNGASYGGLAATYVGLLRPGRFGLIYSQSGSFWWTPESDVPGEWLSRQIVVAGPDAAKFRFEAGTFELAQDGSGILQVNRNLRAVMQRRGYRVDYRETASGHDWYQWQLSLPGGLAALLADCRSVSG